MNIFFYSKTDELENAFKGYGHKTYSYNKNKDWVATEYDLAYVEEDGYFDGGILSSPSFEKSKFFYKLDDIEPKRGNESLIEKADILFTSNFEKNRIKGSKWLNWYAEPRELKKEYDSFHTSCHAHEGKEDFQKSNFLVLDCNLDSVPKIIFEAMAAKTLVLCKRPKNEEDFNLIFENNVHILFFEDHKDCKQKIFIHKNSPEDFFDITKRSFEKVVKFHSPKERAKDIFKFYKGKVL